MKAQTKEMQAQMTPDSSLQELKKGKIGRASCRERV